MVSQILRNEKEWEVLPIDLFRDGEPDLEEWEVLPIDLFRLELEGEGEWESVLMVSQILRNGKYCP